MKKKKKKISTFALSLYGHIDEETLLNDRLKALDIDIDDIISIQEFNASSHPSLVVWYKS